MTLLLLGLIESPADLIPISDTYKLGGGPISHRSFGDIVLFVAVHWLATVTLK